MFGLYFPLGSPCYFIAVTTLSLLKALRTLLLNTTLNIQRTNLVSEMSRWWCLSLSSHVRLSTADGGFLYSRKTELKGFRSIPFCFLFLRWFSNISCGLFLHFYFKRSMEVIVSFQLAICGGKTVFPHTTAYSFQSKFN